MASSSIHDPLSMDLSAATTDLLDFLDTQTYIKLTDKILSPIQRHALTVFADGTKTLTRQETGQVLNILSNLLKNEHLACKVVQLFRPILLDLVARWLVSDPASSPLLDQTQHQTSDNSSLVDHNRNSQQDLESMARAFSLILPIVPQVKRYICYSFYHILCKEVYLTHITNMRFIYYCIY
jgi:hypothetical protein